MEVIDILNEIVDTGKIPSNAHLADLSQISVPDKPVFRRVWDKITPVLKLQILVRLGDLAQDNIELNFNVIFKESLRDPDPGVRIQAIENLWENEDTILIQTFLNMLINDSNPEVQAAAAVALGKFVLMVEMEEINESYRAPMSRALLSVYHDNTRDINVRRRALEAISPLTLPAVQEAIRQAYDSRDERLVVSAVYSMGKTCNEAWLPVIYKELKNPDAEMRYEAAGALGNIGCEESTPRLVELLNDTDIEVRQAVIQAMGEIGGAEAKQSLKKLSEDANVTIRAAASEALSVIQQAEDLNIW